MKIVQVGEPVLRQKAKTLPAEEVRSRAIKELIESMRETMHGAPGVGLAAPQVGIAVALAVIEDKPEYTKDVAAEVLKQRERRPVPFHVIVNPKLTLLTDPSIDFFEGCLSLTGFTAVVRRARSVRVDCLDHKGKPKVIKASGWYARILQHEIDHLHGTVYIDRMETRTFMGMENYNLFCKDKSIAEVRQAISEA